MLRLEPLFAAVLAFAVVFLLLRAGEWLYHSLEHTKDWSPHWGSWVFALLAALFALIDQLGR
jgi:hypothetical protein